MPTNRTRRGARRKRAGSVHRAVVERLISGQWWPFLVPEDDNAWGPWGPDDAELHEYWQRYRSAILQVNPDPWGRRYFERRDEYEAWLERERHPIETVQDEAAAADGCWYDPIAGERIVRFMEQFIKASHGPDAGSPLQLMAWQRAHLRRLFGWKRRDGSRRYRYAYIEVPKKNGKSTECSALVIYLLEADGERAGEVYSAANDKNQASIIYRECERMIQASPDLAHLRLTPTQKTITAEASGSVYQALSRDVPTKEGFNMSGLIVDELHAHKKPDLFETLRYSGAARFQPLTVVITTAGEDCSGVCWDEHNDAQDIISGRVIDWSTLAIIYGVDGDCYRSNPDCWKDEKVWFQANPSLGQSLPIENFRDDFRKAERRPSMQMSFRRYRLNIWGEKSMAWLSMADWDQCIERGRAQALDSRRVCDALRGRDCYLAIDLASRTDLTAVTASFDLSELGLRAWLSWHFAPEEGVVEREQRDVAPYRQWASEGWLNLTPGYVCDYRVVRETVLADIAAHYNVRAIGFDRWNSTQLQAELHDEGFECIEIGQGFRDMSGGSKELESRVISHTLAVAPDPVLRWQAGNVVVRMDPAENIKPDKEKSTKRIDSIVAGIMAERLWLELAEENKESAYNDLNNRLAVI